MGRRKGGIIVMNRSIKSFIENKCYEIAKQKEQREGKITIKGESIESLIESKCHDIVKQMEYRDYCKKELIKSVGYTDCYCSDIIVQSALKYQDAEKKCNEDYALVHTFIWTLGEDKYIQIWDDVVGKFERGEK